MPTPTDRSRSRLLPRSAGVVAVLAVATAVLVLRPVDDERVTGAGTDATTAPPAATPSPSPTSSSVSPPPSATDEEFCERFRLLAESQGQFVSNGGDEAVERLRGSADSLVSNGVPDAMSLPARSGYYTLMSGVYDSIGLELAPAAVGAPGEPVDGGDAAFSAYMGQYCPP